VDGWENFCGAFGHMRHRKATFLWRIQLHAPQKYSELVNPTIGSGPHQISMALGELVRLRMSNSVAHGELVRHRNVII
jgi:hypothetical protein